MNRVDPSGLNPVVTLLLRVLGPSAANESINPTIRQTRMLPEGVLGQTGFTDDGRLIILLNKDSDLATKINALSNECVHYGHLRLRGDEKIPGPELIKSEMYSEIVDALVGALIPPGDPNLKAYQEAVRKDFFEGNMDSIFVRTVNAHDIDFLTGVGDSNIRITLPADAR